MKTIEVKLYSYNELSDAAKERVREKYSENNDFSYIYDYAYESVKKFNDIFGTNEGRREWTDVRTDGIDDCILDLSGERLQRYIWNNYRSELWKGRYHTVHSDKKIIHKRVKSELCGSGVYNNGYYSAVFVDDNCCVLTGVCYDDDLLGPIYKFMDARNPSDRFQNLLEECFSALKASIESEIEYRESEQGIEEELDMDEEIYDENGREV